MEDLKIQNDREPLYLVVRNKLREWVDKGVFRPGSKLPRETELANLLNISRATLREAISIAKQEGWITQIHGVGTFISQSNSAEKGLEVLESVDTFCIRQGWKCETKSLKFETIVANDILKKVLDIPTSIEVIKISRVKVINGVKAAYIEDYVPSSLIGLEEIKLKFQGSVLDMLMDRPRPKIDYAWTNIKCVSSKDKVCSYLDTDECSNLLLAEEILYNSEGTPFEYSLNYMLSSFFNFHIVRKPKY